MMDKKGLSTIVITLIIILVSLVAIGIIWVVVRNLVQSGGGQIEVNAKCLNTDIQATHVNCTVSGNACDVTLVRSGTGTDVVGGVKMIFRNATAGTNSPIYDWIGDVDRLIGKKQLIPTGVASGGVNRVEITAYFRDSSGNAQICLQTNTYDF